MPNAAAAAGTCSIPKRKLDLLMPNFSAARRFKSVLAACLAAAPEAALAQQAAPSLALKPGQEIMFAASVADGRVALGTPRLVRPGGAEPKDGEIVVSVVKHGLSPYADLTATEKTPLPVDFVATGLIGDIKIDEIVVCGRLDAPATERIASGSWRVSLSRFAVHPGAGAPPSTGEGGLGCPR